MSQKITVETTCDRCGNGIGLNSAFWCAEVREIPAGGKGSEPEWMPNTAWPERLDFCLECVPSVFGDVIFKVAKANREARA
jgi:hypothetical protein